MREAGRWSQVIAFLYPRNHLEKGSSPQAENLRIRTGGGGRSTAHGYRRKSVYCKVVC